MTRNWILLTFSCKSLGHRKRIANISLEVIARPERLMRMVDHEHTNRMLQPAVITNWSAGGSIGREKSTVNDLSVILLK